MLQVPKCEECCVDVSWCESHITSLSMPPQSTAGESLLPPPTAGVASVLALALPLPPSIPLKRSPADMITHVAVSPGVGFDNMCAAGRCCHGLVPTNSFAVRCRAGTLRRAGRERRLQLRLFCCHGIDGRACGKGRSRFRRLPVRCAPALLECLSREQHTDDCTLPGASGVQTTAQNMHNTQERGEQLDRKILI